MAKSEAETMVAHTIEIQDGDPEFDNIAAMAEKIRATFDDKNDDVELHINALLYVATQVMMNALENFTTEDRRQAFEAAVHAFRMNFENGERQMDKARH